MRGAVRVRIGVTRLAAEARHGGTVAWRAEAEYAGVADLGETLASLTAELPPRARRWPVQVGLEPSVVQVRTLVDIPPVRAAALPSLVAQQVDRYFRRTGRPLVVDARWLGARRVDRTRVRAAAADEDLLVAVVTGVRASGLRLEAIGPATSPEDERLTLIPPTERARRRQHRRASTRRWALAAGGVWIAAILVALLSLVRERAALRGELASFAVPVAALQRAQREVDEGRAMLSALENGRDAHASFSLRLAAVVRALPDSAYLTSLTLGEAGRGSITGVARRATRVVADLAADPLVPPPRMDGPSVREEVQGKDWERFVIALGTGSSP
jgi:hypothetical protein